MQTNGKPLRADNARATGDMITIAESLNTGIETRYPAKAIANLEFFLPTSLRIEFASTNAPPVSSNITPIAVPNIITIPILPIVLPKSTSN